MNTNKLEIFSEEIGRETVGQGGSRRKYWQGKALVVLTFGAPSDMTRIDFKGKRDEVGLYCFAVRRKSRTGGRTLSSHAKAESEHGVAEDRSRKSVGMKLEDKDKEYALADGMAKLRRGPWVNEGKGRQGRVSG